MSAKVSVVGYLSIDRIITPDGEHSDVPGGAALYGALGARAAGASVSIVACAGEDYPEDWLAMMVALGIDISRIVRKPGPTRRARLVHAGDGSRHSTHHDEQQWWERTEALAPPAVLDSECDCIMLAPMPPELARAIACTAVCPCIADTSAAFVTRAPDAVLALRDQLTAFAPSLEETRLLRPGDDDDALIWLDACAAHIIQKRGSQGLAVAVSAPGRIMHIAAPVVEVVDPTGAGDATVGALAAGFAQKLSLADMGLIAAQIGARAVTGLGPSAFGFGWQTTASRVA